MAERKKFDLLGYINSLAYELVIQFDRANFSTQNVARGENKEIATTRKLEQILPRGIGIGSGFVYDINGNVSNQCDIIVFEKDFALTCEINDDTRNSHYNIESVIAVGEVKTTLDKASFDDCCKKFDNFIRLERHKSSKNIDSYRSYLSKISATNMNRTPVPRKKYDIPMKFIVARNAPVDFGYIAEYARTIDDKEKLFNVIFDLNERFIFFTKDNTNSFDPKYADSINECKTNKYAFVDFISMLILYINYGTTVPLNYESYFLNTDSKLENCRCIMIRK